MSAYEPVERWKVPGDLLARSLDLMRPDGADGCEGIGLWLGIAESAKVTITHLIEIPSIWVEKQPYFLRINELAFDAVGDVCDRDGCYLVGQIHSHPGTFVDLSFADREYGIQAPYFLSVVAPHYAQQHGTRWGDCGVHQFLSDVGFRRLTAAEVQSRVISDDTLRVRSVTLEIAP